MPPDELHRTDLRDVIARRPVALRFSTPALCESRVCAPVTDIAAQLQSEYGDRVAFNHQEVYRGHKIEGGLRAPLRAYNL